MMAVYRRLELAVLSFFIIVLITLNSLVKRVRMSHENGVAARGRIKIVTDPDIPATDDDFFRSGAEFSCRLRHASVSYMDDARLVACEPPGPGADAFVANLDQANQFCANDGSGSFASGGTLAAAVTGAVDKSEVEFRFVNDANSDRIRFHGRTFDVERHGSRGRDA